MSGALVITSQASLSDAEKFACIFRGYRAVDVESGASLRAPAERSKWAPKYNLILPYTPPSGRSGFLEFDDNILRSVIRAWTEAEALQIANERLPHMIEKLNRIKRTAPAADAQGGA